MNALAVVVAFLLGTARVDASESHVSVPDLPRPARMILAQQTKILNLRMRGTAVDLDRDESFLQLKCAAVKEHRYASLVHGQNTLPENDAAAYETWYDGKTYWTFYPFRFRLERSTRFAQEQYRYKIQASPLFECVAWWPKSDVSRPPRNKGQALFYIDMLLNFDVSERPFIEIVDGHDCHVIDISCGVAVWADSQSGFVRRREMYNDDGSLRAKYECRCPVEVIRGVYLPRQVVRTLPVISMTSLFSNLEYSVNKQKMRELIPPELPGMLVIDRDTDRFSQIPGGEDFLERLSRQVQSILLNSKVDGPQDRVRDVVLHVVIELVAVIVGWGVVQGQRTLSC